MPEDQMTARTVVAERDGPVVTLLIDDPARRNPLSLATMDALRTALEAARSGPSVRAGGIRAARPGVSAGHERIFAACTALMMAVHRLPVPVVARVQGLATAAGCQLVAACDLAVAAESARFATPGVRIGLFCSTPMVEVARAVGRARASLMLFTGDPIDAATAAEWGLVARVVPDAALDAAAAALAARVATAARATLATGKRAVAENLDLPLAEAYDHASGVMCAEAATPDAREGIAAFLGKREPVWSDRTP